MKRSKKVELTSIMLATVVTVGACDNIDDRTRQSNMEDKPYQYNVPSKQQKFNYEDEKKLRIDCNKPEDFSLSECHKPQNQQAQTQPRTHTSGFIFMPWFMPGYGGYAGGGIYGPSTSTARNYSSARAAVNTPGLASTYRTAAVNPNAFKGSYFGGTIAAKSTAATTVTRGGFGSTGRSIAASAARGVSVNAGS